MFNVVFTFTDRADAEAFLAKHEEEGCIVNENGMLLSDADDAEDGAASAT